jgi:hypothetical protein
METTIARCPSCGEVVRTIFDHLDLDCDSDNPGPRTDEMTPEEIQTLAERWPAEPLSESEGYRGISGSIEFKASPAFAEALFPALEMRTFKSHPRDKWGGGRWPKAKPAPWSPRRRRRWKDHGPHVPNVAIVSKNGDLLPCRIRDAIAAPDGGLVLRATMSRNDRKMVARLRRRAARAAARAQRAQPFTVDTIKHSIGQLVDVRLVEPLSRREAERAGVQWDRMQRASRRRARELRLQRQAAGRVDRRGARFARRARRSKTFARDEAYIRPMFDAAGLRELAAMVEDVGIREPIIVGPGARLTDADIDQAVGRTARIVGVDAVVVIRHQLDPEPTPIVFDTIIGHDTADVFGDFTVTGTMRYDDGGKLVGVDIDPAPCDPAADRDTNPENED